MKISKLGSWKELEDAVEGLRLKQKANSNLVPRLLFRGHANADWLLRSTLERQKGDMSFDDYYQLIASIQPELETFTHASWKIPEYPDIRHKFGEYQFLSRNTDLHTSIYGYMTHLRHHGFPSPLLDWTRSLQIAGYFAFAKADDEHEVSIYVLSEARMHSGSSGQPQIGSFGPYVRTHRRHFLQQCEYTICANFRDSEWWFTEYKSVFEEWPAGDEYPTNFAVYHFTLPGTLRVQVLEMLDQFNINAYSLFGTEESLLETLALRHLNFPNPFG